MWTVHESERDADVPNVVRATRRGLFGRCPACGEGRLFGRFLKVANECRACGQAFHHHRADDFPPYIVMFAVGHLVGYSIYVSETRFEDVPLWFHVLTWPSLAVVLSLALLQPVKGAVVGLQYGLRMHGFGRQIGAVAGGPEEAGIERRAGRAASDGFRECGPAEAVAEPAAPRRRDPDHS